MRKKTNNMENLVGRKIKGFEFEGDFNFAMKNYIGKIGKIGKIHKVHRDYVEVAFDDMSWSYPLNHIQPHLIPLEVFKLGQKVWDMSISEEAGEVSEINIEKLHSIKVLFKNVCLNYTIDGRINPEVEKTLSTTPYTFLGFSQEKIIERGTVVYIRNDKSNTWIMAFYDEFKEDAHYCFMAQKKDGDSNPWIYCQTENPLI